MQQYPSQVLKTKLLPMMVLRVVLALAFLGITTWFQIKDYSFTKSAFYPLYLIVAMVGLLTILYALLLPTVKNLRLFTYVQVTLDIALITAIVFITGGIESYLSTMYFLSVIGSSILISKRGGFYAASVSSIAYGTVIDIDFYGLLPDSYKLFWTSAAHSWPEVLTTVSTHILAFFTVAYLTGYLAEKMARVERELEEKEIDYDKLESLNRHIVENITSGIMTLDDRQRITSFNKEAEHVTGYTLREVYYRGVNEIFPELVHDWSEALQPVSRHEKKLKKKNGEEAFLGFTISPGQGGDMSNIVIFQDLTQLKIMEEELRRNEKLRALGELSVGIAHEIRNPLASISGSIQVLKEDLKLSDDDQHLMDIVLKETERLNALITDFLLFARPAQEKKEVVDVSSVIEDTLALFKNSPDAKFVKIQTDLSGQMHVQGNPRQIGQVFWNLLVNAAHSMPNGGSIIISKRIVTHSQEPQLPGAAFAEITIADTGKGIAQSDINRIFDPFFSTKSSGTGLGLAIVHRIIESHGGFIDVRSKPGKGTAFRVFLPLAEQTVH